MSGNEQIQSTQLVDGVQIWNIKQQPIGTSLEGLTDVDITSPTNGQALVYNSSVHKWENGTIEGAALPLPYDYIIYQSGGMIRALVCATGTVFGTSDTDLAVVLNAIVSGLSGPASAFFTTGTFEAITQISLGGYLTLVGADGSTTPTIIDYSVGNPTLASAIIETADIFGLSFTFGVNQTEGIVIGTTQTFNNVSATGGGTQSISVSGNNSTLSNIYVDDLKVLGVNNEIALSPAVATTITLDSGATSNYISGYAIAGSVVDNSGEVNYIEDFAAVGVQSAPSTSTSPVPNAFGTKVEVVISIGTTVTMVTKNATAVFVSTTAVPACVTITLAEGESVTLSQTTGVTWTWFAV